MTSNTGGRGPGFLTLNQRQPGTGVYTSKLPAELARAGFLKESLSALPSENLCLSACFWEANHVAFTHPALGTVPDAWWMLENKGNSDLCFFSTSFTTFNDVICVCVCRLSPLENENTRRLKPCPVHSCKQPFNKYLLHKGLATSLDVWIICHHC